MTDFATPQDAEREQVKQQFVGAQIVGDLMEAAGNATDVENILRVGLYDLYRYATGGIAHPNTRLERALAQQAPMRTAFRRILSQSAVADLGIAVAASDGNLPSRAGDNCRIRFERSQAESDRIYIIIELAPDLEPEKEAHLSHLVIFDAEGRCHQFPLPPARQRVIQFLTEDGSDLITLLGAPSSQVLLR